MTLLSQSGQPYRRLRLSEDNVIHLDIFGSGPQGFVENPHVAYNRTNGDVSLTLWPVLEVAFKISFHGKAGTGLKVVEVVCSNGKDIAQQTRWGMDESARSFFDWYSGRVAFFSPLESAWVVDV